MIVLPKTVQKKRTKIKRKYKKNCEPEWEATRTQWCSVLVNQLFWKIVMVFLVFVINATTQKWHGGTVHIEHQHRLNDDRYFFDFLFCSALRFVGFFFHPDIIYFINVVFECVCVYALFHILCVLGSSVRIFLFRPQHNDDDSFSRPFFSLVILYFFSVICYRSNASLFCLTFMIS